MTIDLISKQAETLKKEYNESLTLLPGVTSSRGAADLHKKVYTVYCEVFSKINDLSLDERGDNILCISEIERNATDLLGIFTNTLLTKFPTAKIQYAPKGTPHPTFVGKKTSLAPSTFTENANVAHERKILGDGNCFLYAFLLRFLEVTTEEEILHLYIEGIKTDPTLKKGLKDRILISLNAIDTDPSSLETILNDSHQVLPLIYYLKYLIASVIRKDPLLLEAIRTNDPLLEDGNLDENEGLESLIERKVMRMGDQLSQPLIVALCKALDFPISIVSPQESFPFVNAEFILGNSEDLQPKATLLLKNNHYSVLYSCVPSTTQSVKLEIPSARIRTQPSPAPQARSKLPTQVPSQPFHQFFQWIWSKLCSLFAYFLVKTEGGGGLDSKEKECVSLNSP